MRIFFAACMLLGWMTTSFAARIEIINGLGTPVKVIVVNGEINPGDGAKFEALVSGIDRGLVSLSGPGGDVRAALRIGAVIRLRGFATTVLDGTLCESACGLIWIAGARRYMSENARIGFHAAYVETKSGVKESGVANAEIGAYLAHLGLKIDAIRFFTIAPPSGMLMLTPRRARQLDIAVLEWSPSSPMSVSTTTVAPTTPRTDLPRLAPPGVVPGDIIDNRKFLLTEEMHLDKT